MTMIFRYKKWLIAVSLIILLGGSYWFWKKNQTATPTSVQATSQVERGTLVIAVSSAGQVGSSNSLSASTNVSGVVRKVSVKNDQVVKAGTVLAEIELDAKSQLAYSQALASYQSAKNALVTAQNATYTLQSSMLSKWDTFKELSESEDYKNTVSDKRALPEFVIPQNDWLSAEAQYKNQQAVVAQSQQALSSAAQSLKLSSPTITAPIAGKVTGFSLMKGTVIGESSSDTSQSIATIVTDASPTITVNLTEIDVTKVKIGDKATITIDALPDKTYTAVVTSINTVGSVSSGVTSYPAVLVLDTTSPEIYSNMSAQANIITQTKTDILLIPTSAVQTQNGESTVRVMKDGKEQRVAVVTGLSSGTQTEVVSGLSEGDTVITSAVASSPTTRSSTTGAASPFGGTGGSSFGGANVVRMSR